MPRLSSLPASFLPKVQLRVWTNECPVWPCNDEDGQRVSLLTSGSSMMLPSSLYWCLSHAKRPVPKASISTGLWAWVCIHVSQHLGVGQQLGSFLTNQAPLLSLLCPLPLRSPYVLKPRAHPVTLAHEDELINCLPHPLAHSPSPPGEAAGNSGLHPCHVWSCWIKCRMLVIFKFQINNK